MADAGPKLPEGSELLVDAAGVQAAIDRLAAGLQPFIDTGDCVLLTVMLGGMLPAAWIASRLNGDYELDYCHLTRYRGRESGGELEWKRKPGADLQGRTVLIVDDIYDEGVTLEHLRNECVGLGAARVVTAVLVEKAHGRASGRRPDLAGLTVPDRYVFGAGMDYRHRWRHLQGIHALPEPKSGSR